MSEYIPIKNFDDIQIEAEFQLLKVSYIVVYKDKNTLVAIDNHESLMHVFDKDMFEQNFLKQEYFYTKNKNYIFDINIKSNKLIKKHSRLDFE